MYYQACYGKPGNNWQLLNVSPDIPPHVASLFDSIGSSCTPQSIQMNELTAQDGSPKLLYEFLSQDGVVCVLRAKYGEKDSFGRPKMFAHGYLFPDTDGLRDPVVYLSVADGNFRFSDEETRVPPAELIRDPAPRLGEARMLCGLDDERWASLMKGVYALLTSRSEFPLFIRWDGDLQKMKAAVQCILSALPYPLRSGIAFANDRTLTQPRFKRVMFVETRPENEPFFDLLTGENNLAQQTEDIDRYPEQYSAYYSFVENPDGISAHCEAVQQVLDRLGLSAHATPEDVNLAHLFLQDASVYRDFDGSDLMNVLIQLLMSAPLENRYADDFLAGILNLCADRKLIPNENVFRRIDLRKDHTSSAAYADAQKKLRMVGLLSEGQERVIGFLDEQYGKDAPDFAEWAELVASLPGGEETVTAFFRKRIRESRDPEGLKRVRVRIGETRKGPEIFNDDFKRRLAEIGSDRTAFPLVDRVNYAEELERIRDCSIALFGPDDGAQLFGSLRNKLIQYFWGDFTVSGFPFSERAFRNADTMEPPPRDPSVYPTMKQMETERNVEAASLLAGVFECVRSRPLTGNERDYVKMIRTIRESSLIREYPESKPLLKKIQEFLREALSPSEGGGHLAFWMAVVRLSDPMINPVPAFLHWRLDAFCSPDLFARELAETAEIRERRGEFLSWISDTLRTPSCGPDDQKLLKRNLRLVEDSIKQSAAEAKRLEKEQRRIERPSDGEDDEQKSRKHWWR